MMLQKQIFIFSIVCLCGLTAGAQKKIALEHNGASTFFTDIPTAVAAAVSGDIIYLPGGIFPGFNIDKTLTIIGVGHNPDSTTATAMTLITGGIGMDNSNCDNSVFTGLRINGSIVSGGYDNDNIQISRCFVGISSNNSSGGSSENWTIWECFIVGGILYLRNSSLNNNLIDSYIHEAFNCQIENNIFLSNAQTISGNSNFCTIKNNIFKWFNNGIFSSNVTNCLFYNNIWSDGNLPNGAFGNGNFGVDNINETDFDGLFTNFSYATYNGNINNLYPFNFYLVNAAYNTGGMNGTPIGIYGGTFPWKAGSVPFNPHINLKIIAPATNGSGNLPVQIRARAQNN